MDLKIFQINGEKLCLIIPYGDNRDNEILEWNKKIFDYFNIPASYIKFQFPSISHGQALDSIIKATLDVVDYWIFMENDSVPLRKDIIRIIYEKIKDKQTIFATSQSANHLDKSHIYAAPNFLCFSKKLYLDLGSPSLCPNENCDTAQNLTREAQAKGKIISLIYPTDCEFLNPEEQKLTGNPMVWQLSNVTYFGLGTNYGNLVYHNFMNTVPRSKELFINQCKILLEENFSYKNIEGWFDFEKTYDEAVEKAPNDALFVEIGSFLGKSSCYLAQKIKESGKNIKLVCVDTWKGVEGDSAYSEYIQKYGKDFYHKFNENVTKCGLSKYIETLQNTSEDASTLFQNDSCDFIFIDANHTYEPFKRDLECWYPKLKKNGIIAGHDYANYCDVPKVVDEFFKDKVVKPKEGTTWTVYPEKKIEAIIVSKNYSRYLDITLEQNRKLFNHIIVVGDKNDFETKKIVQKYNDLCKNKSIEFIEYDGWNLKDSKFNFSGARREGLNHLWYSNGWVTFIDSDILILEDFMDKLNDINITYGSFRRFIPKFKDYKNLIENKIDIKQFPPISGEGCGYLQIFSTENPVVKNLGLKNLYSEWSKSAEYCDIEFLRKLCPFNLVTSKYKNLTDLKIECLHLGNKPGLNNEGISEKDDFFNE